jgi:hypothetical protein
MPTGQTPIPPSTVPILERLDILEYRIKEHESTLAHLGESLANVLDKIGMTDVHSPTTAIRQGSDYTR